MKKLIAILLVLLMIAPSACAENIDLSSLSFDELRTLQTRISQELTKRPEWKEVPVPAGIYQIGVDIPAGDWCIKCGKSEYGFISVSYGSGTNESGTEVSVPCEYIGMIDAKPDDSKVTFINIKLKEGYYISFDYGSAIFTTPEKVKLDF